MQQISPASYLALLDEQEKEKWLSSLSPEQKAKLRWDWDFWARPNQLPPEGDWNTWVVLAGRGFGKTRMGSEWVRRLAHENPGCRIALVAETAADARDVMIKGDSGLLNVDPTLDDDCWSPTNRCLSWPNGSKAYTYNGTTPDQLRGPQHHFGWVDELAKFEYMQDAWDQLQFGLRLGEHPQVLVTTTPRPLPLIKKLVADPDSVVTRGSTLDNKDNLAKNTVKQLYDRYSNTRLGRQELEGEILGDIPGALWARSNIDESRVKSPPEDLERVLVAVDPATSSEERSDENGIVVVGLARDEDGYARGYVLEDASLKGTPEDWAKTAVKMYRKWQADKIVAEKNQGGEMVSSVIKAQDRSVPVKLVHASRGKVIRAEPISALYEQQRVHHVGMFPKLEDQMCEFSIDNVRNSSTGSPDRVDALVWGLTELFEKIAGRRRITKNGSSTDGKFNPNNGLYDDGNFYDSNPYSWMA
ncbi:MAG: putative terminase [Prokaryotic dsDNA virus sp.]|nr:MAG: putative terminase [Prokaryotic dsDNA virus sp.]